MTASWVMGLYDRKEDGCHGIKARPKIEHKSQRSNNSFTF